MAVKPDTVKDLATGLVDLGFEAAGVDKPRKKVSPPGDDEPEDAVEPAGWRALAESTPVKVAAGVLGGVGALVLGGRLLRRR